MPDSGKYNSAKYISATHFVVFTYLAKMSTILYFCISAYIVGLGFFIILAKFGKNSQNFYKFTTRHYMYHKNPISKFSKMETKTHNEM